MIGLDDSDSKFDNPYQPSSKTYQRLASSETTQGGGNGDGPLLPPFQAGRGDHAGGSTALQSLQDDGHWIQDGGEPPPEFTPYEAEHWVNADGNVVSHDPHLNEDGEALYRFLLSQAMTPPKFAVRCRGTHSEVRTRTVTHMGSRHDGNNNRTHTKTETYTETVVDFDFSIDISQYLLSPVNWTVADDEPAYRGKMVREVEVQDGFTLNRHSTTRKENKAAHRWRESREQSGYPPWVQGDGLGAPQRQPDERAIRSSRTFRQWADEYCESDKLLKEFVFEKVVYGWNVEALRKSVEALIKSTYYSGNLKVTFPVTGNKIYIRPTNTLSRALSHWWIKLLLWLTLIYPFIWLFKRFAKIGGGVWQVTGAAYPLKEWVHVEDSIPGEDVAQYLMRKEESLSQTHTTRLLQVLPSYSLDRRIPAVMASSGPSGSGGGDGGDAWADRRPTTLAQFGASTSTSHPDAMLPPSPSVPNMAKLRRTPKGISQLVGLREGEWFRMWEATLTRSVLLRLNRRDPIVLTGEVVAQNAGATLDGFHD